MAEEEMKMGEQEGGRRMWGTGGFLEASCLKQIIPLIFQATS